MDYSTASQCWTELEGIKSSLMLRLERYAAMTIPKLLLPAGFNHYSTDQTHDYQSIGAQATNHLTNKMMLALFAPSRPFFRLDSDAVLEEDLAAAGLTQDQLVTAFAGAERKAVKVLDKRAQRPKLYTLLKHLIVLGNTLLFLGKEELRVIGIRYWCVKRDVLGRVYTLVIKEEVKFDELEPSVQAATPPGRYTKDAKVCHYKWIQRDPSGDYVMTQWVDEYMLPKEFNGKWPEDEFPYRVLTWDLADEADYGTSLVEEYAGDLEALSILSESVVDGSVLGAEYRWMIDPTSQTQAADFNDSENGDALPGRAEDCVPVQGGNPTAITVASAVLERYERRVALGFLMQGAVTRDAERVTAEEIRRVANELETSYGGVYSGLGNSVQRPVAHWLMKAVDMPLKGSHLDLSIITGLDALSRNGDLENLQLALMDLAQVSALPPEFQGRIKFKAIADYVGAGRGVDLSPFIKSEEEYAAYLQQAQQARVAESNATAMGEATAKSMTNKGT